VVTGRATRSCPRPSILLAMPVVLGINAFHADASACVLRDGRIVVAVAEERLGPRRKHHSGFPALAIIEALRTARIAIEDVDIVAVGHDPRANVWAKARYAIRHPVGVLAGARAFRERGAQLGDLRAELAQRCGFAPDRCRFRVEFVEHHLAHVASSFYLSPFSEAAAFTYDASGDFVSALLAHCDPSGVRVLRRQFLPHSLGTFYTAVCQFIGFDRFGEEYKVMGLAAYGQPRYLREMERLLRPESNGLFSLDMSAFRALTGTRMESVDANGEIVLPSLYREAFIERFGPPRARGSELTQRDRDIAASCQAHFERVVLHSLARLHAQVPVDALVTAGGCALNGVCNARILRETPFRQSYIHGAAGDDGTAVGAALWAWHHSAGQPRTAPAAESYWGPAQPPDACEAALRASGLVAEPLSTDAMLDRTAALLARGVVVGWFQGRSEWGPRALGNRSILAHPGWPGMKELINVKIKRREQFRPFAPSILAERVADYFEQPVLSPFMMHVAAIRPERRAELSAVVHEDGTGRLHTVTAEQNPLYHELIRRFAAITGTPVLLNTSFNENEPIVETPQQAIDCYLRTDLDALVLGSFLLIKENPSRAQGDA
jgi:carbamoyltransferase